MRQQRPPLHAAARMRPALVRWLAASAGAARLAAFGLALFLAGCAALPAHVERPPSQVSADVAATTLARIAGASRPDDAGERSGFRLLPEGGEALDARLALIRTAETSIDVQYYLIADDSTGRQFLGELAAAAARGVRVRVLVDDLNATREDALFAALAGQPRFEVRLFNPLPVRGGGVVARVAFSMHEFARINHRMHNKLLIADNSFAITGGRNIADEYFDRSGAVSFIDMDLLSSGAVVAELSAVFDGFWNSPHAYPVASLIRGKQRDHVSGRTVAQPAPKPMPASAVGPVPEPPTGSLAAELARGHVRQRFAPARMVHDSPARVSEHDPRRPDGPVMRAHLDLIASARSSVMVATPYFVPGAGALAALRDVRAKDVRLTVLTNSLASTDQPLAHFGYARYRLGLLKLGIALHELMPTAAAGAEGEGGGDRLGSSLGRLHAKLVVVDDRFVSIGSMNMDRRSARSNTESAIVVDDPVLAGEVAAFLERGRVAGSYALRLGAGGTKVEWVGRTGEGLRAEPRRPGAARITPRLASFFISEEML